MKYTILLLFTILTLQLRAQLPDHTYAPNISSVKLFRAGDMYSYPSIILNSGEQLELHFDDLDADYKNFYFTFQLCNADWSVSNLQTFDFIKGFQSTRITNYRNASISQTRYTHYQATLPDRSSVPTRSGNYLLKVFRNNDTAALFFTKRFLVIDNKVAVTAQIKQPFSAQLFMSDQRVQVAINTANSQINTLSPQDLKVRVLQNYSWPTAALIERPTIYRGNYYEYNDDATSFSAGREWRWADLRSLRLMSDRMQRMKDSAGQLQVFIKPDGERKQQVYVYYRDINGLFTMENSDGNNPYWQSDCANVHFTYMPPGGKPYAGKDVYLFGEITNYASNEKAKMIFNAEKGVYEQTLFLKQGFYNYSYITTDAGKKTGNRFSFENTEGDFTNTENNYTILVYYRAFGARADELIGVAQLNSLINR